jgi:hypothetical protein
MNPRGTRAKRTGPKYFAGWNEQSLTFNNQVSKEGEASRKETSEK